MPCKVNSPDTIKEILDNHVVDDLKAIRSFLYSSLIQNRIGLSGFEVLNGNPNSLTRKADLIEWILSCLTNATILKFEYELMTDLEKSALQEIVHASGVFDYARFDAKYGDTPHISIGRRYSWRESKKEPNRFPPLSLFMTSDGLMSREMLRLLRPFVPEPGEMTAQAIDTLPDTIYLEGRGDEKNVPLVTHHTEKAAATDLMTILQLVDMGKLGVSPKTGKPTLPTVRFIRQALSSGDFYPEDLTGEDDDIQIGEAGIRPFAWIMLIQAAGLVQINGSKLALNRNGKAALNKPATETLKHIWERWLNYKDFHEFSRIDIIKGQKSKSRPLYMAPPSRSSIADALSDLEVGKWIQTDDFFTFLIARGHRFDILRDAGWALYIGSQQYGSLGYNHVTWDHINGRFARAFLLEYAATLGVIDVALIPPWGAANDLGDLWGADDFSCLSRYDGLYALCLNSLGAWIMGLKEDFLPQSPDQITLEILPNLEITALGATPDQADRLFLERFCHKKSDRVWEMRIATLLQAIEEGIDLNQIIGFLKNRSQGAFPQPVTLFFDDMRNRIGQLQDMGEARLVKCQDRDMANRIAKDVRMNGLCMTDGGHYIVVPAEKENRFRKELRNLGYILK
ncbi:MAG: hypothetical protein AB7S77_00720 [Desulfatirhabdiaceae bacterium]